MALILTLSRGAIFAFGLGAIILLVLNWRSWKKVVNAIGLMIASFALALIIQGSAAVINPNFHERFSQVVAKSIHQLSLGAIDLRQEKAAIPSNVEESLQEQEDPSAAPGSGPGLRLTGMTIVSQPAFDGYVPESTDVRVNLSKVALNTWSQNPITILAGVGLGGAGVAMANFSDSQRPREIVQNEYVEILLERGVIGIGLFASVLFGLFYATRQQKWTWAIIAAFLVQWNFFSGLPNALHIYLILILLFVYAGNSTLRRGQSKSVEKS
jgi:hypothetical protein